MFTGFPVFLFVHLYLSAQACLGVVFAGFACLLPSVRGSRWTHFIGVLVATLCGAILIFVGVIFIRPLIDGLVVGLIYYWEPDSKKTIARWGVTISCLLLVALCRGVHYQVLNKTLLPIEAGTESSRRARTIWFVSFFAIALCFDVAQCVLWLESGW